MLGTLPEKAVRGPRRHRFRDCEGGARAGGRARRAAGTVAPAAGRPEDYLAAAFASISRKSSLAAAIRYSLSRWPALCQFTPDRRLEITNNAADRAIRPLALGRKNYLFAGSDAGGRRAAILYTLIQTATLNSLDPEAYLRDVLARIADHPINRIDQPAGTGPARPPHSRSPPDPRSVSPSPPPSRADAYHLGTIGELCAEKSSAKWAMVTVAGAASSDRTHLPPPRTLWPGFPTRIIRGACTSHPTTTRRPVPPGYAA